MGVTKQLILGALTVVLLSFNGSIGYAQSLEDSTSLFSVFIDINANGLRDLPDDAYIVDWNLQFFDTENNLVDTVGVDSPDLPPESANSACLEPQDGWAQTHPLSLAHPDNPEWFCHQLSSDNEISDNTHQFGVTELDSTPERIGEIVDDSNSPSTEKLAPPEESDNGAVLGSTTDPPGTILAATGTPTTVTISFGVASIFIAYLLACKSELD